MIEERVLSREPKQKGRDPHTGQEGESSALEPTDPPQERQETAILPVVPTETKARMVERLLGWYRIHKRDLPWRGASPYAVWVSEIMLQQTQVATVIPFFRRFLERFPTVEALAEAPIEEALKY